ncbi:MAG TPA: sigma-70 family RNA polymerase sigma factor, partial [Solirubrobacteraceae bacterium]|nr:sigma-70 family RNA polymerase sigma factor [Solirubrobacteraceae bacterium]
MSPLSIRRYRAERLLRADFERLRGTVIALAERRLRAADACLDRSDLDAAYSQAWHGLYAAVLEGREIDNPAGWLATVTFRRAVDEHRSRARARSAAAPFERATARALSGDRPERQAAAEPDLASALDDRIRLRRLMEGLRARLSGRELEAASLCYLQGLPRAQAAARMGVSDAAMRRLMDGRRGRPGVARKFGSLVGAIDSGDWCAEQGSLMRGFAFGILDPEGRRYQLAVSHHRECPACRSYVLSLRGLAAVLPPAPLLVRLALLASSGAGAGTGASAATGSAGAGAAGAGAGAGVAGASGGAVSATGAAGGGLLIAGAGPAATKLAVGCLLALGVGAGCVALGGPGDHARAGGRAHVRARVLHAGVLAPTAAALGAGSSALGGAVGAPARASAHAAAAPPRAS